MITINHSRVRFERNPDNPQQLRVAVQVLSTKRPDFRAETYLDPGKAVNAKHLAQGVGAAGVLLAEYLATKYGDLIDPACASRDAIQALGEEVRMIAELSRDLPGKLSRLKTHAGSLADKDRERLDKLHFQLDRGGLFPPEELEWVNERVAEIHSKLM